MSKAEPRRGRSVAASIVALVVTALAAGTLVMFAVTFNGPPPMPAPLALAKLAATLRQGSPPAGIGRDIRVIDSAGPPVPRHHDHIDVATQARLAGLLDVPAAQVVALLADRSAGSSDEVRGPFQFAWRRGDRWRIVETAPEPLFTNWHRVTLAAMLTVLAVLSALAWLVARAISRPLRQVADAALSARAGAPLAPLPAGGAAEVRDLARAVETMHDRLQRHAEGRNAMLGAIAHDLGTPLSRLAFWVEQLPDAARLRATADIGEMRAMIGATLALAREEAAPGDTTRIDLGSLLDSLVEDMGVAGAPVTLTPGPRVIVRGDSGALRRVFQNLIENALRYGSQAAVGWTTAGGSVAVTVDDAGPGLGGMDAERLFQPFVRGDPSRNRATGGTGLGLAIVRTLVERHGGAVTLCDRPTGGAQAIVRLPSG